jgi:hypothetical protein
VDFLLLAARKSIAQIDVISTIVLVTIEPKNPPAVTARTVPDAFETIMTSHSATLRTTLATSITLCQRFGASLAPGAQIETPRTDTGTPSPLLLLEAAVTTLRAQVTKLSLLAITAPFTPSAVTTCLNPLNESILTSLVTASLLTTAELTTASFSLECRNLVAVTLRDLQALLKLLEERNAAADPKAELSDTGKKAITETAGKIWDDCDRLLPYATGGVPAYVVRRAQQWLDLMKDAVTELTEWDPEEDVVDDDPLGLAQSDDEDSDDTGEKSNDDRAAISVGVKEQALKVLSRIPQSIHVVVKQRLEKTATSKDTSTAVSVKMDGILSHIRHVSELIDESAEGIYLGDLELCLKKAGEARAETIEIVESVVNPMINSGEPDSKENKYIQRALEWIRQVDTSQTIPVR